MQMSRRQQTRTTRRPQPTPSTPACLRSLLRLTTEIPTGPHHHGLADRIARAADGAHSGRPCGASSILPRDNGRVQRKYGYGRLTNLQCLLDFCRTSKRPPRQRRLARPGARGGSRGPRAPGPFRSTVGAPTYHNPEVIFNALSAFSSVNPSGQSCELRQRLGLIDNLLCRPDVELNISPGPTSPLLIRFICWTSAASLLRNFGPRVVSSSCSSRGRDSSSDLG